MSCSKTNKGTNVNKGTGAGGAKTNENGLGFEKSTCNIENLKAKGFTKKQLGKGKTKFCLLIEFTDLHAVVYFASKKGFVSLIKHLFNVEICKEPDEAYVIHYLLDNTYDVKIIEKKNQNTAGSVDEKLMTGNSVQRMYQKFLPNNCNVSYAFCVSNYLKSNLNSDKLKYKIIREIFEEDNTCLFYGEDADYLCKVNLWIGL